MFIIEENYKLFLNTSFPDTVAYSGIIVEKNALGYIIRGYDKTVSYFTYFKHIERARDPVVNVGGVSENFLEWQVRQRYIAGQIVRNGDIFYRVLVSETLHHLTKKILKDLLNFQLKVVSRQYLEERLKIQQVS